MSRTDATDHEEVDICLKTKYQGMDLGIRKYQEDHALCNVRHGIKKGTLKFFYLSIPCCFVIVLFLLQYRSSLLSGYVSWGEYPMNFAAVLGQEEIYRLILAKVRRLLAKTIHIVCHLCTCIHH